MVSNQSQVLKWKLVRKRVLGYWLTHMCTFLKHLNLQCHNLWLRFDTIVVNLELNSLAFVGILSLPFLPCLHKVKEVPTYETFYGMNSWNIWGSASAFWLPSSSCHPRWFGFWKGCLDTFGLWSQSRTYLYFSSWLGPTFRDPLWEFVAIICYNKMNMRSFMSMTQ